jgi:hypothetical protein
MRQLLAASAALTLLAVTAAPAVAGERTARFSVTLKGTYSTTGSTTESDCFTTSNDTAVPLPPQTATATDTTRFASTRANSIQVSQTGRGRLFAGRLRFNRILPLRVTDVRSSNHGPYSTVPSCRPSQNPDPQDCGSKTKTLTVDVYGSGRGHSLGFSFIRGFSFIDHPEDIFTNCWLGLAQQWFGRFDHTVAPASPARLFNPRVHRIVLTGKRSGTSKVSGGNQKGTASFTERYTLTLIRIR